MRIWDIDPKNLCRKHLLGEHYELHALWTILTKNKKGFGRHPETLRWKGKLKALYNRHEKLVKEMENRGYQHQSNLNKKLAKGKSVQKIFLDTPGKQRVILRQRKCECPI